MSSFILSSVISTIDISFVVESSTILAVGIPAVVKSASILSSFKASAASANEINCSSILS